MNEYEDTTAHDSTFASTTISASAAMVKLGSAVADLSASIQEAMARLKEALNDPLMIKHARNFRRYTRRYARGKR